MTTFKKQYINEVSKIYTDEKFNFSIIGPQFFKLKLWLMIK